MAEEKGKRASVRFLPEEGGGLPGAVINLGPIISELQAINNKLKNLEPCCDTEQNLTETFPITGATQALAVGVTTIDYVEGIATVAGVVAPINLKRKLAPEQKYKSVRIYTDKEIRVEIKDGGTTRFLGFLIPGYTPFANLKFERIVITTTVAANVQVTASLKPYSLYGLDIELTNLNTITVGRRVPAAVDVAERLTAAVATMPVSSNHFLTVQALPTNNDYVYIGGTQADAEANIYMLGANAAVNLKVNNAFNIWVRSVDLGLADGVQFGTEI